MSERPATPDLVRALLDEYFSEEGFAVRLHDREWDEAALRRLLAAQRCYLQSPRDVARFERDVAQAFWLPHREARRYRERVAAAESSASFESGCERLHDMAYWLFMGEPVRQGDCMPAREPSASPAFTADELGVSEALLAETVAEGGFLLRLRCELEWDREAFARLVDAMRVYAAGQVDASLLEREAAGVFWYAEWFVPQWASHPDFPREFAPEYYARAFDELRDLAIELFVGS